METHEFEIQILPDGQVKIHIKGVKGPACEEYARLFQRLMSQEGKIERTHEYYEPPTDVRIDVEQRGTV
ncbi:MAG: DUF2997 domain-containing protein [Planctomycetota bacterium]|nr:DUF2997 domain-containing protein [Planctomycetota bacterium]